ncbi:hypothetical protein AMS68_006901 [Peltaster fructicola]|uniref:Transcriptional regulatory protein n=1 Tax=Peltaster fructicola TaxID=286661 RepID=A0A6H0Y2Z4_9PEZI|nr:hypothetical protein AMS68_006901 [Peltaster fructicola]
MAPSRGASLPVWQACKHLLTTQHRRIHATTTCLSGHNRWSKIRHDKGKNDAARNKQRSIFAQELATASRLFGADPNLNPRLADLIVKAKREGFPKTGIEAAIARGQGRSPDGGNLENVTIEAIMPNNVGLIIECETDGKARTIAAVKNVIKVAGGVATPSSYLFEKRGRIVFEKQDGITSAEALDAALDAGATDIDELEDGQVVVFTEPEQTRAVGDAVSKALSLDISMSGIVWSPNTDTMVAIPDEEAAQELCAFVDELHEKESNVQALAMNISQGAIDEELWKALQARVSA